MYRFLLVDDSRVMRRMLANALRASGYGTCDFVEASDGEEALARLQELDGLGEDVDAIFCDLCMPNLDGIGLIDELSRREWLDRWPVIVCTGDLREEQGEEALARGARRIVGKPFRADTVADALEGILPADGGA